MIETNWQLEKQNLKYQSQAMADWLDKVYPADIFKEPFTREQIAWAMACYVQEQIYNKFYLTAMGQ